MTSIPPVAARVRNIARNLLADFAAVLAFVLILIVLNGGF